MFCRERDQFGQTLIGRVILGQGEQGVMQGVVGAVCGSDPLA